MPREPRSPARAARRVFWLSFLPVLAVYVYTLAPSVVLRDSGELVTAAYHLGVPHPPGYPLLTILSWLFTHLPVGNIAWRVNLLNAISGAAAVGVLSLILFLTGHLLFRSKFRRRGIGAGAIDGAIGFASVAASLVLAFSHVMWSQSVLAEKYALNTLCLGLILLSLLYWIMRPHRLRWLYLGLFFFGLGLTTHQTLLFLFPAMLALAFPVTTAFVRESDRIPRPSSGWAGLRRQAAFAARFLIDALFVRDGLFRQFFIFAILLAGSIFTALAVLSDDLQLLDTCLRFQFLGGLLMGAALCHSPVSRGRRALGLFVLALALACLGVVIAASLAGGGGPFFRAWLSDPAGARSLCLVVAMGLMVLSCALLSLGGSRHGAFPLKALVAVWAGLSFYAYLYFSSLTNPPMNWGYARTRHGFYESITRGQYRNNLPVSIKKIVSPLFLVASPASPAATAQPYRERLSLSRTAARLFWDKLVLYFGDLTSNFTYANAVLIVMGLFYARALRRTGQIWLAFVVGCFFFLSVPLVYMLGEVNDRSDRWINRVFFLPSHYIYAMFIGYGLMSLGLWFSKPRWRLLMPVLGVLLTAVVVKRSWASSEQRGHDFGWRFGHDMLKGLERDAIVFGGTDPGRFVPTYMIFVESFQPRKWRRDPDFDRRDLYIITQNALANRPYREYIRDHYDTSRPPMDRWYHRWLGRDRIYPKAPLQLPSEAEFDAIFNRTLERIRNDPDSGIVFEKDASGQLRATAFGLEGIFAINGEIARWIFERNKARHAFYVEESYPILWMYPYLEPCGLIMKLNSEPVPRLSDDVIARDRAFWADYSRRLLADPRFCRDEDARKAFSKLRCSIAGLYAFRGNVAEAERAYLQAIELFPPDAEARARLIEFYLPLRRFEEARRICQEWIELDPTSPKAYQGEQRIEQYRVLAAKEDELAAVYRSNRNDYRSVFEYAGFLQEWGKAEEADQAVDAFLGRKEFKETWWQAAINLAARGGRMDRVEALLVRLTSRDSRNALAWYNLALVQAMRGGTEPALASLERALRLDPGLRARARTEASFKVFHPMGAFQRLLDEKKEDGPKGAPPPGRK